MWSAARAGSPVTWSRCWARFAVRQPSSAPLSSQATQRLAAVGATLLWEQADALPPVQLPQQKALHLYRIVREAISNALRHAEARRLRMRVRVAGRRLDLELTDDGAASCPDAGVAGTGMRGMRARANALEGDIAWLRGTEGGTKVLLSIPLDAGGEHTPQT